MQSIQLKTNSFKDYKGLNKERKVINRKQKEKNREKKFFMSTDMIFLQKTILYPKNTKIKLFVKIALEHYKNFQTIVLI